MRMAGTSTTGTGTYERMGDHPSDRYIPTKNIPSFPEPSWRLTLPESVLEYVSTVIIVVVFRASQKKAVLGKRDKNPLMKMAFRKSEPDA
jgi:hypothetical protein